MPPGTLRKIHLTGPQKRAGNSGKRYSKAHVSFVQSLNDFIRAALGFGQPLPIEVREPWCTWRTAWMETELIANLFSNPKYAIIIPNLRIKSHGRTKRAANQLVSAGAIAGTNRTPRSIVRIRVWNFRSRCHAAPIVGRGHTLLPRNALRRQTSIEP